MISDMNSPKLNKCQHSAVIRWFFVQNVQKCINTET